MKRYERQIVLPEIGILGQQKLTEAKVLIIGMGGLGCPVLQNLVAAGVGKIGIVDGDVVEETNLNRQFLYSSHDVGRNKVAVAAEVVSKQNPEVALVQYSEYFTKDNCLAIISDYHLIVDCTDNISTRYLINDVAIMKGIPMVYGSIHKFEGQLSVFNYQNGPTYRCVFPESETLEAIPNCNDAGVLGVLPNLLGSMQANEVLKIILGIGHVLSGVLMLYNSLDNSFQSIEIQKNINLNNKYKFRDKSNIVTNLCTSNYSLIIDIREAYEEPKLNLENCKNVPLSQLENFMKEVDLNQEIILVCQYGNRSELAVDYLLKKGFKKVFHLQNGIESQKTMNSNDVR
ncbi:HesA/MoeB/ThiF family protein [Flavobacterium sp. N1994]|uniref:HesA/MoeB/ThiF family protein n=1 Tax=Flavobacterium sp. N1994 TaxID=2986827 RepID=UPI00222364A8|nr:HesA/MoeB/ThiF family protein [Flavobacterium sp. N1994]